MIAPEVTNEEIDAWAARFAADLTVAGQHVPLDRVLAQHLDMFDALRTKGLTWQAIANVLSRAGACRRDGRPISHDQLRADVPRLRRKHAQNVQDAFSVEDDRWSPKEKALDPGE